MIKKRNYLKRKNRKYYLDEKSGTTTVVEEFTFVMAKNEKDIPYYLARAIRERFHASNFVCTNEAGFILKATVRVKEGDTFDPEKGKRTVLAKLDKKAWDLQGRIFNFLALEYSKAAFLYREIADVFLHSSEREKRFVQLQ